MELIDRIANVKKIHRLAGEIKSMLESAGYHFGKVNHIRIKRLEPGVLGECYETLYMSKSDGYGINISDTYLENFDTLSVIETIIHEYLHTMKGYMNHTRKFRQELFKAKKLVLLS